MREGFGGIAYRRARVAQAIALLLTLFVLAFSAIGRSRAAGNGTYSNDTYGNGTYNGTYDGNGTYNGTYDGNGTYSPEDADGEAAGNKKGESSGSKTSDETQQEKPKKQLAAEQYALGVLLAGAIAIGMMIAVFFYYAKHNGGTQE